VAAYGGIDLGGTKIETVVVGARDRVLASARRATPVQGGPAAIAAEMADALREACVAAGVETARLSAVGVGSPGLVDTATGIVSAARNLSDWEGSFALGAELSAMLGTRVAVGNDVSVATRAEFDLGAGKPYASVLGVFWGTGVGGGVILNGKDWSGRGSAGEIGHMVVKLDGARCGCGRLGCMEAYAGRAAMEARARKEHDDGRKTELFKLMKKHGKPRLTSSVWEKALDAGDKLAIELIERAVEALGAAIASSVNLLDIEAVVIGGGLGVRFGQPMADRIASAMLPHLVRDDEPPVVVAASLGDLGGALGASLLARSSGRVTRARARAVS
jgi:glucokinase